jgi:hypothetical protein
MTALEQQLIQPPAAKPSLIQPSKDFRANHPCNVATSKFESYFAVNKGKHLH